jgi:tetratricopeptide (TPR) repeat protein
MLLPKPVIDAVKDKRAFLFLGAGASYGALSKKVPMNPPIGQHLAKLIAKKFLGKEFENYPLQQVSELAASETSLIILQEYVASIYYDFFPADFHRLLPKFIWRGIATTNYDLIVERSYAEEKAPLQHLVVFKKDGEGIEEKLRDSNSLMYLKLHGCLTYIEDVNLPLILSPDQYITHKKGRARLFEKFYNFSLEYPVFFIGYSLSDYDIRTILNELSNLGEARPRSYVITPNMSDAEVRFWESRKITHIKSDFNSFLRELDSAIPPHFRNLSKLLPKTDSPILNILKLPPETVMSERLTTFLRRDVDFLHQDFKTEQPDPKSFYKGYFVDWAPIAYDLDVKRKFFTDAIISEIILSSEEEKVEPCEFIVIKGYAGSGKSVILRRLAWDASNSFDKLCIFVKESSILEYEPLLELYRLCNQRILLFIDPLTEYIDTIEDILQKSRKDKLPITLVCAERNNEWNSHCKFLEPFVNFTYDVPYLNEKEIEDLIRLLTKYRFLGYLADKTFDEQKEALSKHAGRQLLVALHEATLGKPFTEIIVDEYKSITSIRAQSLYLTVCIFHRLNVPVRAGLISRVHGIPFSEFSESLFLPLDSIVFAKKNDIIHDFEYRTRHSHIAEIAFERILLDAQDRFDEYMRIINVIDIDYNSDREAFKGLMNSKELLSLFTNQQMIRQLYQAAHLRDPDNPMLYQQEAIFEMHSKNGSLEKATNLLSTAKRLAPYSKSITHSMSELALLRAEKSTNEIEKHKYLEDSKKIAENLIKKGDMTSYSYHTIIKIGLSDLEELLLSGDDASIERKVKEIEKIVSTVIQQFPDDSYILDIESKFNVLISNHEKALQALEKAFEKNKRSPYIASRLAKLYEMNNRIPDAINTLKDCLEENPGEKHVNFQLAMLLRISPNPNNDEIIFYLRRSFTSGDTNYFAQFWFARFLYLYGERAEAKEIFTKLSSLNIDNRIKKEPRGIVMENSLEKKFSGYISKSETSYAFIIRDQVLDSVFTYSKFHDSKSWAQLRYQIRVTFNLSFNYFGPFALNIQLE